MDFVDDGGAVGKRLLTDTEFQLAAAGSNEETNITGSADPGTTGGHSDTAGRRMISNIGCEDMCGAMWQWLQDQSYYYSGATGYYGNLPGAKGSVYTQFAADPGASEVDNSDTGGDIKLIAGSSWAHGTDCGSRSRYASNYRWVAATTIGARFGCDGL
jgi:formylglycine-generating enzyme required for sulfatase activity